MSNLQPAERIESCDSPVEESCIEVFSLGERELNPGLHVRRALPQRSRRRVGAWCFLDYFDHAARGGPGMDIPPHPHIGLQTVSWLLDGEILHRDSLGSEQRIRPGELNLMTAGHGIAHSEESLGTGRLRGLQLWTALPLGEHDRVPAFSHHPELPSFRSGAVEGTVFIGTLEGATSPAAIYSPLVGAELRASHSGNFSLATDPGFEYAVLPLDGRMQVGGQPAHQDSLYYLGAGRRRLAGWAEAGARLLLIGGLPLDEQFVLWWNFVAHNSAEIEAAREDWVQGRRFGRVPGYPGDALGAPPLRATLKPT